MKTPNKMGINVLNGPNVKSFAQKRRRRILQRAALLSCERNKQVTPQKNKRGGNCNWAEDKLIAKQASWWGWENRIWKSIASKSRSLVDDLSGFSVLGVRF